MFMYALREDRIRGLDQGEVKTVLCAHNPEASANELEELAKILSLFFEVVTELPKAERDEIARDQPRLRTALSEALSRISIKEAEEVEATRGSGLGKVLEVDEGRQRLSSYSTPMKLEDWAGEVAGAGRIEERLGIKRSTLGSWYKLGAVIGLLRGQRKLAYPVDQFVDARPVEGLGELLKLAPDARSAWLWARQPHGLMNGHTPLKLLQEGRKNQVIAIAQQDFA